MVGPVVGAVAMTVTVDASNVGSSLARSTESAARGAGERMSSILGGALKAGAAVTGAAVGAVLGAAITSGFSRLVAIDNATAKLEGLGHSADTVTEIMNNALASVKGTSFGLGEAASQAATMVASGIKPGEDLTRTLKLVADTATIAGVDMGEMGSIFGKVAAGGKVTGEVLAQLSDRGIPAVQFLADSLGKTVPEVQALVSAGKIGFPEFQAAMEQGLGGAALASGDTFQGALKNTQAALGRLGASVMGGVFSQMPGVFGSITGKIDLMGPAATKAGEALGRAFASAVAWVERMGPTIDKIQAKIAGLFAFVSRGETGGLAAALGISTDSPVFTIITAIRDRIGGAFAAIQAVLSGGLDFSSMGAGMGGIGAIVALVASKLGLLMPFIAGLIPSLGKLAGGFKLLLGPIPLLIAALVGAYATSAEFRGAIDSLLPVLLGVVSTLAGALLPVFTTLVSTVLPVAVQLFTMVATTVGTLLAAVLPLVGELIGSLVPILLTLVTAVLPIFISVLGAVIPVVTTIITALLPVFVSILTAIIPILTQIATAVLPVFVAVLGAIIPVVMEIITAVLPIFMSLLEAIMPIIAQIAEAVLPLFTTALEAIMPVIEALLPIIMSLINVLLDVLMPVIEALLPVVQIVFDTIATVITAALEVVKGIIKVVTGIITGDWSMVWEGIKQVFSGVWDAIKGIVLGALNIVKSLLGSAWNAIKDKVQSTWDTVKILILTAWDNIKAAVTEKIAAIIVTVTGIKDKVLGAIADFGNLLKDKGRALIQGLIDGITAKIQAIKDAMGKVASAVGDFLPGSPVKEGPLRAWNNGGAGKALVGLLAEGLTDTKPIDAAMKALTAGIEDPSVSLGLTGTGTAAVSSGPLGRDTYAGYGATGPTKGGDVFQVNLTLSVDDLARMTEVAAFVDMLRDQRVLARRTERSGRVNA